MSARTPSGHAWDVDWTIRDLVVGLAPVVATTLLMRLAPSALGTAGGTAVWLGQLLWMAAFPLALRRRRRAGPAIARVDLVGVGYGLLGGVGLLLLSSVWMLAFADAQAMNDARGPAEVVARGALWVSVAFVVLAGTLGPWIEETYFRGFLLHALRRRLPGAAAVAIQAVLFSFCHGYGWSATALIAAMGLVLGVLARRHATLVIAVTAHVTVNAAATLSVDRRGHAGGPLDRRRLRAGPGRAGARRHERRARVAGRAWRAPDRRHARGAGRAGARP
ncbi:MAG: CPBP family intramembrane metalloprotease [Deltaproteobacteria bacterium]|nr:CPBP family intramembrane metalloprotease [Deltaproteobacteria bacterium]